MEQKSLEEIVEKRAIELIEKSEKIDSVAVPTSREEKSFSDIAMEHIGAITTLKAIQDEGLQEAITDKRKEEILASADTELKREAVKNKEVDIKLQEADYGVYMGVATYAGIKKPLPQKMQNILFLVLSIFQTICLVLIGIPISIINITSDAVDSVVKKLSSLTKSAMWIVLAVIMVFIILLLFYFGRYILLDFGVLKGA
jgi:hypothetical protein